MLVKLVPKKSDQIFVNVIIITSPRTFPSGTERRYRTTLSIFKIGPALPIIQLRNLSLITHSLIPPECLQPVDLKTVLTGWNNTYTSVNL